MTPGEAVARKQRGILDDTGHADVSVEESQSSDDARANLRAAILRSAFDRTAVELPDFTSRTDSNGADWDFDFDDCSMIGDWWAEPESTPIYDELVLADLASQAPRPSLWTRTPDWVIGVATLVLLVLLALPLVLS